MTPTLNLGERKKLCGIIEYENWKFGKKVPVDNNKDKPKLSKASNHAADVFKDLFGDA